MASTGVCINLVNGTTMRLPTGCVFRPTNGDLVVHYLHRRAIQEPLPCDFITSIDILQHNPWDIVPVEERMNGKHFFIREENKCLGDHRSNHAAGDGFWRSAGSKVPVYHKRSGGADEALVGMKRTLVFHYRNSSSAERTKWVMQEFRLAGASLIPCPVTRLATGDGSMLPCRCAGMTLTTENSGSPSAGHTILMAHLRNTWSNLIVLGGYVASTRRGNEHHNSSSLHLLAIQGKSSSPFLGQPSFEEGSDESSDVITDDKDGDGHGKN